MESKYKYSGLEVAIIGMACRFPGAVNWREFWHNLTNGVESIRFLSEDELIQRKVDKEVSAHPGFVNSISALKNKDMFDAAFFEYGPGEAALMNPMHRVFHECVWEALEDAAYDPEKTEGSIGLFAGGGEDLNWKVYSTLKNTDQQINDYTLSHINNKDYLTSLLSYKLNLKGPSFSLNTACSTSLVAVNLACKSLLFGETKMALAGGVSLITHKQKGYFYEEGMIASSDGHCRAFDKNASGTFGSEGAGVVVLKRLTDAISDGDTIYAVIKGSAVNNDGNRKVGYTAPSIEGQAECIKKALKFAKTEPETISYIEAHGTGTKLGDPIEMAALNAVFSENKRQSCAVGSVKTNIGHLDTAAGIAGLIKVALSLKHGKLPPSLNFKEPNPEIDFENGPCYINTELKEWRRDSDIPLRAGISSFGIGGTNAHVILEEAPHVAKSVNKLSSFEILNISAKTEKSLKRYLDDLKNYLEKDPGVDLSDMAYTFQIGRKEFAYRISILFNNHEDLLSSLNSAKTKNDIIKSKAGSREVAFMFSGQGSQYTEMGKDLYETEPLFKKYMDEGFAILENLTGESFKTILFSATTGSDKINETRYTQPLIFLFEYSLSRLIMSFGISPACMIGHSIGEYTAACISGIFSFEDALKLVVKRGELIYSLPRGSMISLSITAAEAEKFVDANISIAAINGPDQVVLSGNPEAIQELIDKLNALNISFVKLNTSHAFHSAMLDNILKEFENVVRKVSFGKLSHPFISNVSGKLITEAEAVSPAYWVRHMRGTVLFSEGIKNLLNLKNDYIFIEVGPGNSLTGLLKKHGSEKLKPVFVNLTRHSKETANDSEYFAKNIGKLWSHGVRVDWKSRYSNKNRRRIPLPTYSFEPVKFAAEVDPFENGLIPASNFCNENSNQELKDWIYYPSWKQSFLLPSNPNDKKRVYLFFSHQEDFSGAIRSSILKKGDELIEVFIGKEYNKISKNQYSVDPCAVDINELVKDVKDNGFFITDVIYSWAIDANESKLELVEENREINISYFSLIKIIQSLQKNNQLNDTKVVIITNSLQNVIGTEKISGTQSLVLGLANVLPQEFSVNCLTIDVVLEEGLQLLAKKIAEEVNSNNDRYARLVALRNGKRWIYQYQKNTSPLQYTQNMIEQRGVYLITGGLGNVGFVLAKYLIQKYAAKIILLGRKKFDLNEKPGDIGAERLKHLVSLNKDTSYYSVDVSNTNEFAKCIENIQNTEGPIKGIIHAAGNIDMSSFELIEDITFKKSLEVFSPKINGIKNIYDVFKNKELDFVWITSSLASALGGLSYSSYASANLFMDYFISARSNQLPQWKCVNLGEMLFTEDEIREENTKSRTALKPEEITQLFEWSLNTETGPVILETVKDLFLRAHEAFVVKRDVYLNNTFESDEIIKLERPDLSTHFVPPVTDTENRLVALMETFFGVANIGIEDNFFELGGDSLKAMVLLKRIKKEFNLDLSINEFFNTQTIKQTAFEIDELKSLLEKGSSVSKNTMKI